MRELTLDDTLDFTALVPEAIWDAQIRTLTLVEYEETLHARYGYGIHGGLQKRANC